eukprot:15435299-Alexandrium_andersonii.AAC.1
MLTVCGNPIRNGRIPGFLVAREHQERAVGGAASTKQTFNHRRANIGSIADQSLNTRRLDLPP